MVTAQKQGYTSGTFMKDRNNVAIPLNDATDFKDADIQLQRGAIISGTVVDDHDEPVPNAMVQVMLKTYQRGQAILQPVNTRSTDDRGNYRAYDLQPGRYYVQVATHSNPGQLAPHYAPALYPNATRMADAQMLKVGPGEEVSGIKIVLKQAAVFNVSGRVIDMRSAQPAAGVNLNAGPEDWMAGGAQVNAQSKPDGTFRLNEMTPGRYRLDVNMNDAQTHKNLHLVKSIEVTDRDVNNLQLLIGNGVAVKGTIRAEGGDLPPRLRVQMLQRAGNGNYMNSTQQVFSDVSGNFQIPDVQSGKYDLQISPAPAAPGAQGANQPANQPRPQANNFFVGRIMLGNQEVTDSGITVPEDATVMEVSATLDFRYGTISGRALEQNGNPLPRAMVVLVSADPKKRESGRGMNARQANMDGTYQFNVVVPGDYLMLLWPGENPGMIQDPDVMQQLEKYCERITVAASQTKTQDAKLIPELRPILQAFSQQ